MLAERHSLVMRSPSGEVSINVVRELGRGRINLGIGHQFGDQSGGERALAID